jgi:ketosteroid isomerase-like protein
MINKTRRFIHSKTCISVKSPILCSSYRQQPSSSRNASLPKPKLSSPFIISPPSSCRHRRNNLTAALTRKDLLDILTDPEIGITDLQKLLDQAIDDEDYDTAAQLRDEVQKRRQDGRLAIEEANLTFYNAFQSGNITAMADIIGTGQHVQCIHPLSGCVAGREAVLESWKLVLGSARLKIAIEDVRIYVEDNNAWLTCIEVIDGSDSKGRIAATNIFQKQNGKWKIVHHHGSPCPPGG